VLGVRVVRWAGAGAGKRLKMMGGISKQGEGRVTRSGGVAPVVGHMMTAPALSSTIRAKQVVAAGGRWLKKERS
jgi:hypothetical protein